jgi:hypothetical protein
MASRKLKVESVNVRPAKVRGQDVSEVLIVFSRKLTPLEVSGVRAVLEGEIK